MLLSRYKFVRQLGGLLETASVLSVKLALRRPRALRRYPGAVFRTYMKFVRNGKWKSVGIQEVFPELALNPPRIQLEAVPGDGLVDALDELVYLALITKAVSPSRIFEIGTFRGRTALVFA